MKRGLPAFLSMVSALLLTPNAQAEAASIAEAVPVNAFINCLLWTRDGLPISELASEGKLIRENPESQTDGDAVWSRSMGDERLTLVQHNDGSRACSIFFWTPFPDQIVEAAESSFSQKGDDWPLDFRPEGEAVRGNETSRSYRQHADKQIGLTVTTFIDTIPDQPSAALTFYFVR